MYWVSYLLKPSLRSVPSALMHPTLAYKRVTLALGVSRAGKEMSSCHNIGSEELIVIHNNSKWFSLTQAWFKECSIGPYAPYPGIQARYVSFRSFPCGKRDEFVPTRLMATVPFLLLEAVRRVY